MVYVFFAPGFEESEALVTVDMLMRGGLSVKMVAVGGNLTVEGTHGIKTVCDCLIEDADCTNAEALILPGGMPGVTNLHACEMLCGLLTDAAAKGIVLGAICAAPSILGALGLLRGKKAVCFPGFEDALEGACYTDAPVVTDGKIVTSKAAGTVFDFSFALLTALGKNAEKISSAVYYRA